jgi:hypothetical protein
MFIVGESRTLTYPKTLPPPSRKGRGRVVSPGSESTACSKRDWVNVGGPYRSFGTEVSVNKCSSEDTETAMRKSEGVQYRGSRVTPVEGRPLGNITLGGDTSWVHQRPTL